MCIAHFLGDTLTSKINRKAKEISGIGNIYNYLIEALRYGERPGVILGRPVPRTAENPVGQRF